MRYNLRGEKREFRGFRGGAPGFRGRMIRDDFHVHPTRALDGMRGGRPSRMMGERGRARGGAYRGGMRVMRGTFRGRGYNNHNEERPEYPRER
jgi:hypothetical protein